MKNLILKIFLLSFIEFSLIQLAILFFNLINPWIGISIAILSGTAFICILFKMISKYKY